MHVLHVTSLSLSFSCLYVLFVYLMHANMFLSDAYMLMFDIHFMAKRTLVSLILTRSHLQDRREKFTENEYYHVTE